MTIEAMTESGSLVGGGPASRNSLLFDSQMACLTASFTLPQRKLSHGRARGALRVQAVKVCALPGLSR